MTADPARFYPAEVAIVYIDHDALRAEIARYGALTPQERAADDHARYLRADERFAAQDWPTSRLQEIEGF